VPLPDGDLTDKDAALLRTEFEREYTGLFSRTIPNAEIEILTWTLSLATQASTAALRSAAKHNGEARASGLRRIYDAERDLMPEIPVYLRAELMPGARLAGPAIIAEDETTTFVSPSFDAFVNAQFCIVLDRKNRKATP
jgi:N-methylhydantoinase A